MDGRANSLDDSVSAGSSTEYPDRLSTVEQRLQTQEDEITLLKSALADALRRISFYDEQIPLLKQQLAENSGVFRGYSPSSMANGTSTLRKLSTSSMPDSTRRGPAVCMSLGVQDQKASDGVYSVPEQRDKHGQLEVMQNEPCLLSTVTRQTICKVSVETQTEEPSIQFLEQSARPQQIVGHFQQYNVNAQLNEGHQPRAELMKCFSLTEALDAEPVVVMQKVEVVHQAKLEEPALQPEGIEPVEGGKRQAKANELCTSDQTKLAEYESPKSELRGRPTLQKVPAVGSPLHEVPEPCLEAEPQHSGVANSSESLPLNVGQPTRVQAGAEDQPCERQKPGPIPAQPKKEEPDPKTSQSPVSVDSPSQAADVSSPLPLIQTLSAQKKALFRRNSSSDKLVKDGLEKTKHKLSKKAASSANLLTRSTSLENRAKDLLQSAGSSSRRGTYNLEGLSIKMFLRGRPITMYIPSYIHNYEELKMEYPPEKLRLDWVYGYRGRDCRSNLHLLATGEVVYFIACVVVLYHTEERTQRHFLKHTDCVKCLAVHPDKVRVVTGQTAGVDKDGKPLQPLVYIWDSSNLNVLQQIGLGFFERGIGSVAFSRADQGAHLCVVDDSNEHMLSVWEWAKESKQAEIKSTNEAVFAVEFNPADSGNIITCGKSHVYFWTRTGNTLTKKQGIFGKYKKPKFIQCFVFSVNGDVLTGDSEGNILTWGKTPGDTKTLGKGAKETYQIVKQTKAHEGSIFVLCVLKNEALLSGGGKDRKIIQWNQNLVLEKEIEIPEQFGAVRTITEGNGEEELLIGTTRNAILRGSFSTGFSPIVQGHTDELWGLATHPFQNLFLTCGHDKQLCLWNAADHTLAWNTTLEETGLCADFHPSGLVVSAGLNSGRWVVLDMETKEIVTDYIDGNEQLSVVRYSPDGNFLAVGSHDNFIYIYTVTENGRKYIRFGKCVGHSSFITHLDWSKDGKFIMSNSGDYEILYWDVAGGCKLLRNRFDSKDREWASYTCVLGFHVFGEICRLQVKSTQPCNAPSHMYGGHGSHVTNVRFTHNDSHLISMGGKDTSILQWRVVSSGLERSQSASSASVSSLEAGNCG
nr:PREDICTED: echinoderm microtubule-associated protein-like 3 [Latimeria chalumnae]|eukprot:XP_014354175.1 PREDICTED: echinoderm microtubule-associated protein-like 3 [Latimeria chalumnae]